MNKNDVIGILERIRPYADGDDELAKIEGWIKNLTPECRDWMIEARNTALEQAEFGWAVELSHAIYAMANPAFWENKTVELSAK